MDKTALVKAVRDHARKNYERDGWDYVVECYDDADIIEAIGDARTEASAIVRVKRAVKAMDDHRKDIQAEAF